VGVSSLLLLIYGPFSTAMTYTACLAYLIHKEVIIDSPVMRYGPCYDTLQVPNLSRKGE